MEGVHVSEVFSVVACPECGAGIFSDSERCFVCGATDALIPRWAIDVLSGDGDGVPRRFTIRRFPVSVGRDSSSDVCISDRRISRNHLVIEEGDGEVFVRELDVTNRGRLDGRPLKGIRRWSPEHPLILSGATLHLREMVRETE